MIDRSIDRSYKEALTRRHPTPPTGMDALVFAMEPELQSTAIGAAASLRRAGLSVDLQLEARKAKWGFKHADRIGATYAVLVGSGEAAEGTVAVKCLATGTQEKVAVDGVGAWVVKARDREEARGAGSGAQEQKE